MSLTNDQKDAGKERTMAHREIPAVIKFRKIQSTNTGEVWYAEYFNIGNTECLGTAEVLVKTEGGFYITGVEVIEDFSDVALIEQICSIGRTYGLSASVSLQEYRDFTIHNLLMNAVKRRWRF